MLFLVGRGGGHRRGRLSPSHFSPSPFTLLSLSLSPSPFLHSLSLPPAPFTPSYTFKTTKRRIAGREGGRGSESGKKGREKVEKGEGGKENGRERLPLPLPSPTCSTNYFAPVIVLYCGKFRHIISIRMNYGRMSL